MLMYCGSRDSKEPSGAASVETSELAAALRKAKCMISKLTRERDHHRMEHRRLLTERDRLSKDMKRLSVQYGKYEPAIAVLKYAFLYPFESIVDREKYETLLKEKILLRIERDRLQEKVKTYSGGIHGSSKVNDGEVKETGRAKGVVWSAWPKGPGVAVSRFPLENVFALHEARTIEVSSHGSAVSCVDSLGDLVVSGGDDMSVKCLSLESGEIPSALGGDGHSSFVTSVRILGAGNRVASSGGDGFVKLWWLNLGSVTCMQKTVSLKAHASVIWSMDVHASGPFLVTGSMDHSAKLLDLEVGKTRHAFRAHVDAINSVKFFDENSVVTGSADKSVSVWDMRSSHHCSHTLFWHRKSAVNALAVNSSHPSMIASGDMSGTTFVTDLRNMSTPLTVLSLPSCINSLEWLNEGKNLVGIASRDGSIAIFDTSKTEVVHTLISSGSASNDTSSVLCLRRTDNGIVSSDSNGGIKIWSCS